MNTENKTFTFKTNINCGGCIAKIKPVLDHTAGIEEWNVDTENKDKILTVKPSGITENEIIETVKNAGFKIELFEG